ncbi:MAG: hypothetical protein AAB588_01520, partial [Patescibacteria group bacterium]
MASFKRFVAMGLVAMLLGGLMPLTSLAAVDTTSTISVTRRTSVFDPSKRAAIIEYNVQGPDSANDILLRIYNFVPSASPNFTCETPSEKLAITFGPVTRTQGTYTENWNGADKNGNRVAPGDYCFDLRWGNPPANARPYIQGMITVTNNPATQYAEIGAALPAPIAGAGPFTVTVDPSVIIPTATAGNAARISYTVTEALPNGYSLKIEDSGSHVVATLVDQNIPVAAGVQSITSWNGRYNNGTVVPPGDYYFRFHVNGKSDLIGVIRVENPNTGAPGGPIIHYVDPAIINPTLQNPINATIRYTVNSRITTGLSIAIRDGNNTVKLLSATNIPVEVGSYSAVWDGRYNNGVIVPAKTYTYVFISNGQVFAQGSIAVSYSTTPPPPVSPFITTHNANPAFIVQGQSSVISYTLGKNVTNFRLSVRNQSGTINETLMSSPSQVAGSYTQTWSGRFQNGVAVADPGTYVYMFEATNEIPVAGSIVVNTQGQAAAIITDLGPTPSPFDPLTAGTVFRYQLTQDSRVDITILSGLTTVKHLLVAGFSNNGFSAGTNNTGVNNVPSWDGRNDGGTILANGTYTYVIAATNANGPAQPKSGSVTLGSTVPTPLDVNTPTADPNPFNPDTQLNLQLKFNLNLNAYVTVTVTRQDTGAFVKTLTTNQFFNAGTNLSVPWSATDMNNSTVPAGVYNFRVDAGLNPNQIQDTTTGSLTINRGGVQSGALDITNIYADPTPFNPELRRTYFTFTINKPAQITVT